MKPVLLNQNLLQSENAQHIEFVSMIEDLWDHPSMLALDEYGQHLNTSRRQHSLNVAYVSYRMASRLNLNVQDTVRGALLHDLYLYDWRTEQPVEGRHVNVHPAQALSNACAMTEVSDTMADCIVNHMWPLGDAKPQSKEAWVVQAADKLCAVLEIGAQLSHRAARINLTPMMLGVLLFAR